MTRRNNSLLRVRQVLLVLAAIFLISQLTACASLHDAAKAGDTNTVRSLLDSGADVNAKGKGIHQTPLHVAASKGHTETARLLIERGADINAKTTLDQTPLYWAAIWGKTETAKLLIELGADKNAKNNKGQTALDIAQGPPWYEDSPVDQKVKETAKRNRLKTVTVLQTVISEKQVKAKKKKARAEKKRITALKKKQKCRMKESKWIYMSKSCRGKYASGKGVAVHVDGNLRFEGTIKNGKRISGELFYDGQPMFDGPIAKGKPNGKGICYYENEPEKCEFYRGKRVDSIYKQRIALARQNAKQQFEMQQLRADMKKDMSDLKAAQAASGGTQTDSMGNIIKKELVRKGVNELFNQLF